MKINGDRHKCGHCYTEESRKAIYKQAPMEIMKRDYLMLHMMDSKVVIKI